MSSIRESESATFLKRDIDALRTNLCLTETEESWERIASSITRLRALCEDGGCELPAILVPEIKSLHRPITNSMISERTRLSGVAIDFVSAIASGLGGSFEPLIPVFIPTLLTLCSRTNKVVVTRSRTCITSIIEATQSSAVLPYFLQSIKEKSTSLRLAVTEGTLVCLNCCNPPDLEKEVRTKDIEAIIRISARDANADVRKGGRKVFEGYKILFPTRVDSFTGPLTPTIRKYLDIKTSGQKPSTPSTSETGQKLSSSTSALQSKSGPSSSRHVGSHIRSASASSTVTKSQDASRAPIEAKKGTGNRVVNDMPPPQYVPVRPVQPARQATTSQGASIALGPVRPARDLGLSMQSKASSGRSARVPPSSDHSNGPIRAQIQPTTSQSSKPNVNASASGPRRIPVPEKAPEAEEQQKPMGSRPTSRTGSVHSTSAKLSASRIQPSTTEVTRTKPEVHPRSKALPTSRTAPTKTNSTTAVSSRTAKPAVARSVTQPTLSQLARSKLSVDSKVAVIAVTKPLWGRPGARKVNAPKPTAKLNVKPSVQALSSESGRRKASTLKATSGRRGAATPTQVPLPPSPKLECADLPTLEASESVLDAVEQDNDSEAIVDVEDEVAKELTMSTLAGDGSAVAHTAEKPESIDGDSDEKHMMVEEVMEQEVPEHDSAEQTLETCTPPANISGNSTILNTMATKTPISALLTSIQQGFEFTPSSPLSPPQHYAIREPLSGVTDSLNIPFNFHMPVVQRNEAGKADYELYYEEYDSQTIAY